MGQSAGSQRGRSSSAKPGKAAKTTTVEENGRTGTPGSVQNMPDLDFLRGLIDAVDQSGIDSLEIIRSGTRIRIAKTPAAAAVHATYPLAAAPAPVTPAPPAPAASAATAAAVQATAVAPAEPTPAAKSNLVDVKSPMVGTFYRAPAPDAPAYVEVGSTVTKGQTLCVLEAMKLMNELECEQDGVIREILVDDADPVEYGQVLYRIEPSS
ncbi:MAG: acetyl-CoA carboxylase biotin carboxyl carrier protein [Gemmatimonadota bacterium]